jgi:ATP-dependent RNA helicase DeaD
VVFTLPHDWGTIPQFLGPALERLDPSATEIQLLVVTPDVETAIAVADAALDLRTPGRPLVVPVTRPERAARQLRARAVPAVAGDAGALGALLGASALKLGGLRTLVLAWADAILDGPDGEALEAVLAELPRETERILVASRITPDVEALIERSMRRARRVAPASHASAGAIALSYVATAPAARATMLRRILDELDPGAATVLVGSAASEAEVGRVLRTLGYAADGGSAPTRAGGDDEPGSPYADETPEAAAQRALGVGADVDGAESGPAHDVVVTRGVLPATPGVVILYDLPAHREVLERVAAARPAQTIALVQPRQLDALRGLAGGPVRPLPLHDAARQTRARDAALRTELRAELGRGLPPRELLALEPLLEEHDGLEVAAAALRLLARERTRRAALAAPVSAPGGAAAGAGGMAAPGGAASGMVRLFVTAGSRDGVRPGDLVGAITGEAAITSERLGKIEVRDAFSLVEVAAADAARVVERVNGIAIRGRKVVVRLERDAGGGRPERGDRPERGAGRGAPAGRGGPGSGGARGPRPPRDGGDRPGGRGGERGAERGGERPGRGGGSGGGGGPRVFDAVREGPRGFGERDDRGVRERAEQTGEWAQRAERLRRARRAGPEGGDPAGEPPPDRGIFESLRRGEPSDRTERPERGGEEG